MPQPRIQLDPMQEKASTGKSPSTERNGKWEPERSLVAESLSQSSFWANSVGIRIESAGLVLDGLVNFTTMDGDMLGRLDTETDLVSTDLDHGHRDVVIDNDALVLFAGENQHNYSSLVLIAFGADRFVLWAEIGPGGDQAHHAFGFALRAPPLLNCTC